MTAVQDDDLRFGLDSIHQVGDLAHRHAVDHNVVWVGIVWEQVSFIVTANLLLSSMASEIDDRTFRSAGSLGQPLRDMFEIPVPPSVSIGQECDLITGKTADVRVDQELIHRPGIAQCAGKALKSVGLVLAHTDDECDPNSLARP